jgi:hypothetical protein
MCTRDEVREEMQEACKTISAEFNIILTNAICERKVVTDALAVADKKIEDRHNQNIQALQDSINKVGAAVLELKPYIDELEEKKKLSEHYQAVVHDLKGKGTGWKFWLGLLTMILAVIAGSMALYEKIIGR